MRGMSTTKPKPIPGTRCPFFTTEGRCEREVARYRDANTVICTAGHISGRDLVLGAVVPEGDPPKPPRRRIPVDPKWAAIAALAILEATRLFT